MSGRTLLALAAMACLAGCGAKLSERAVSNSEGYLPLDDVYAHSWGGDIAMDELRRSRKLGDQVWVEPQFSPPTARGGERRPVQTLMQVEITVYAPVDCAAQGGEPGVPKRVETIWMLPAQGQDAGPWTYGPPWIGTLLREAGVGVTVHFPPHHRCGAATDSAETFPRRVFLGHDELRISSREPFSARVLQACPVEIRVREQVLRSHHAPLWRLGFGQDIGFTVDRSRRTARVAGRCKAGETWFELGPFTADSALDPSTQPRPQLTSSTQ
jgi:hypothetical protein